MKLLTLIIISFAISPAFALGEGNRNLFLIALMSISPLVIIYYKKLYPSDLWLLLFIGSILLFPPIFNPESVRWSTMLYSAMFGITFIAYKHLLYNINFSVQDYLKIIEYLIYAYFITLLIQQFCVLTGLPIFNISNYDIGEPWKLNSLSAEPSHSGRIIGVLMYSYISVKEILAQRTYNFRLDIKTDRWIWIAFLWVMLTMGSATAMLFIAIVLFKFIRIKNLLPLSLILGSIFFAISISGSNSLDRMFHFSMAILTFDTKMMIEVDHSASMRIVPMIILTNMLDVTTINGLFGHGVDYVGTFLSTLVPGIQEGAAGGGLLQLWIEYGFLSFLLFTIFCFSHLFSKKAYLNVVLWFLLIFISGVNNQMVWLTILLLFTNRYFEKQKGYVHE